jgi:TolA-binding protein
MPMDLGDLNQLREMAARLEELQQQGLNDAEIERRLEQEQVAQRRQLQQARGALNADSAAPGTEPTEDPLAAAMAAGKAAGGRGSDDAFRAYADRLFASAAAGDDRVAHRGTVDHETRERWLQQARQRQVANRDRSSFTPK